MKAIQIAYDQDFEKKCKIASEVGFKHISVNLHGTYNPCDDTYDRAPEHIMGILDKYKLNPAQTHLFFYNTLTSAHKTDDALEHRIMREVEVSGKIGAPWCVWHTRYYKSGDDFATGEYSEEKTFYYSQKNVTKYVEQAQKFGTGIALENLFRDRFYGGYSTLAQLCDSFKADNVGICWDTGHAHLVDYDQGEAIRFMGERIKCTHIHNNFKDRDSHLPPDEGTIDWDNVMKGFKDIGYSGPLTLETHCLYPQDEQFMRDFARYNLNCLEFLQRVKERV